MKGPGGLMKERSRWKNWLLLGAGVAVFLLLVFGLKGLQFGAMMAGGGQGGPPPEAVAVTAAVEKNWPPVLRAVGTISPVQGSLLSAEVPGIVAEVAFQSGAMVKKGDLLVRLNSASEEGQVEAAEAEAELARAEVERARDLARRKVISQAELDAAEAKFKRTVASTDTARGTLDKLIIRAPFDGHAGIRQVNVGQTVKAGDPIVTLQAVDPIFVDFTLPQQRLPDLKEGLPVTVRTDAFPEKTFEGKLTALNSVIDPVTRNVSLQATLPNPELLLRPGMFGKVEVTLPQETPTVVIPATAVSYAPFGDSVYVLEKKKDDETGQESLTVRQQFIRIGETRGDLVGVTTGLKPGDQVVSAGVFKLRNGMAVQVQKDVAPKPEENPTPANT